MQVLVKSFYSRLLPSRAQSTNLARKDWQGALIYGLKPIVAASLTMAILLPIVGCNIQPPSSRAKSSRSAKMFSTWKTFTANQGKYSILMPGTPETFPLSSETPQGLEYKTWIAISTDKKDPGTVYLVHYVDGDSLTSLPINKNRKQRSAIDMIQYMLNNYKQYGMFNGRNMRTISSSQFSLNDHPGGEVRFRYQKGIGRIRFFAVEKRVYVILVHNDQKPVDEKKMTHFLQSFKLL
jgi:hypothetical protein